MKLFKFYQTHCSYWHRSLNPKKLVEVKFSHIGQKMTIARMIKLYKLPAVRQKLEYFENPAWKMNHSFSFFNSSSSNHNSFMLPKFSSNSLFFFFGKLVYFEERVTLMKFEYFSTKKKVQILF